MANRLHLHATRIANQISPSTKSTPIANSAFDYLSLADYLTPQQNSARLELRQLLETQVIPKICAFVQRAEFPEFVIPLLRQVNLMKHFAQKPQGLGSQNMQQGVLIAELARADAGLALFLITNALFMATVQQLGSNQQQQKLVSEILSFSKTAGTTLIDTRNLTTPVTLSKGTGTSCILNGTLNVIGHGGTNIECVWAKSSQNQLAGFLVELVGNRQHPNIRVHSEVNRYGMRILRNRGLTIQGLEIPIYHRLEKSLKLSESGLVVQLRLWVCWMVAGICIGVYDSSIKYASQRSQFNRPISGNSASNKVFSSSNRNS